jgi:uncharacterized membrane protein
VTDAATASGIEGNEELTAWAGLLLIPLLVVVGVTLFFMRQLIVVHLFVGLVLVGPVCLKLASAGYRFTRYYTREPRYRRKGPPPLAMRLIAPIVVVSTVVMLVSGVLLLIDGPSSRDQYLELHKVSCIVWVVFVGLHVLGHLAEMPSALHATRRAPTGLPSGGGESGRRIALIGVVVAGIVLAIALTAQYGPWTAAGVFQHHHHVG